MSYQTLPHVPVVTARPEMGARGSVLEVLEKLGTVVVPIAVGVYALLYLGFESVYDTFGITPEQAGLTQASIFGHLLGTLVLLFLAMLPLLGLIVGIGWLVDKVTRGLAARVVAWAREKAWLSAAVAAGLSGIAYWGLLGLVDVTGTPVLLTVLSVGLFGLLVPYRLLRARPAGRAAMRVLTGALVGMGVGFTLVGWMTQGAEDVRAFGQGNIVLELTGFPNQWAEVRDSEGRSVSKGERWLVLGQDAGAYVFYDCGRTETIRRPIEATILSRIELDPDFSEGDTKEVRPCGYAHT
ncbi:hypothetical protein HII36_50105 [Nonomuraea sp. NN258]|uniref:hypothetical protein n=1 Tax=Nonomuraea antri TaxID=2730852 RepID=UPI001569AEA2|nr:hypothetical protein [Nonomuraea antri]NRQ39931.1 hypothetical protein [Nonomuraea antri]